MMFNLKSIIFVLLVFMLVYSCQEAGYRDVKQYTIEQFLNTTSIFGSSFSPDEKTILFSSDQSGIFNAYKIELEGKKVGQLTNSDSNSVFTTSYFPNDNRILFRSDKGGNEIYHIYVRKEDGSIRDLTPDANARSLFAGWSFDQNSFYYMSNKRDPRYMDLYEMSIDDFKSKLIFQNDKGYNIGDISNDKRYLALSKSITRNNTEMYLYDFMTKELKHLSEHEGDIVYQPVTFSVDSKILYYLTDEDNEFQYLVSYNTTSGEKEITEKDNWDIMYAYFSRNGKYKVVGVNADARTDIHIYDNETGKQLELPKMPNGSITSVNISNSENLMAFYVNGSTSPSDLYVYNFNTRSYNKLTASLNKEIDAMDLVDATIIRYPSFDDLDIPSVLYVPKHLKKDEKAPALVWVHGGPGGQSRIGYNATIQYLVNHGYVILAVNNRGSSGYGKTFYRADDQKHGDHDLRDCVEAKKFLVETGKVDPDKIGILGGSYGGYMVLAALTFQPEEFEVGIDLFGISNWVRTLESIPSWWESYREALYTEMGNPETQRDMLLAKSPLFHADQIQKPLMVLQGANDPRVLKVESDEIVEAVKKNNVPVEYIVFEDEGHGFVKKENRIKGYKALLQFADKYLKGETAIE